MKYHQIFKKEPTSFSQSPEGMNQLTDRIERILNLGYLPR